MGNDRWIVVVKDSGQRKLFAMLGDKNSPTWNGKGGEANATAAI